MAFDNTLPAGGPANFVSPNTLFEAEGVGITFLSVEVPVEVSPKL